MSVMLYVIICVLHVVVGSYAPSLGPTHHYCVLPIFIGSSHHCWPLCFVVGPYTSMLDPTLDLTCRHWVLQLLLVSYRGQWALLWVMGSIVLVSYLPQLILSCPCLLPARSHWPVMLYWLCHHCFPPLPPPPCRYVVPPILLIIFARCHSAHIDSCDEPYYARHNMANFLVGSPCRYECCVGFEHH